MIETPPDQHEEPQEPSERDVVLARFADLYDRMRAESRLNVTTFLLSASLNLGGVCVLQAPHKQGKRSLAEAHFSSERFGDALSGHEGRIPRSNDRPTG